MLEKNLNALSKRNSGLVQKILIHNPQGVEVSTTESGEYNLVYNGLPLHDEKNPQLEASIIFGDESNDENTLYVVFGLGLGYLFKRSYLSSKGFILLIEPSLDILKSTLTYVDFSQEINDNRVFIVNEISEIYNVFTKYIYEKIHFLHLTSYKQLYSEYYDKAFLELNNRYSDQKTNLTKSIRMANSFTSNISNLLKRPSIEVLSDLFLNKPIIVAAAGPSLDKAIDLIADNRDKFVLICVGQSVKAFYNKGIIPDIVVILEMLVVKYQLLCLGDDINKINLVLQPTTYSPLFDEKTNSTLFYLNKNDFMSEWFAKRGNYLTYPQGGSVSLCALNIAHLLGGSPIILVGHDLAYTDGKAYASRTSFESVKLNISEDGEVQSSLNDDLIFEDRVSNNDEDNRMKGVYLKYYHKSFENTIKVKGQKGEDLLSRNSYAAFIPAYEEIARNIKLANSDIKLLNCSEGGANLNGFENKPFVDVVSDFIPLDVNPQELITEFYNANKPDEFKVEEVQKHFDKLILDLKNLKIESNNLLKAYKNFKRELKISKTATNNLLNQVKKIQKYYNKINEYNVGDRIAYVYPFIQRELYEYNLLKSKRFDSKFDNFVKEVDLMAVFAETMILASDRTVEAYKD